MEGAASVKRLGHAVMEKQSEENLQHPTFVCTVITFAILIGRNYLSEGKRSWVIQVLCVSALEKRRYFALGWQNDSVWTFQQFGLQGVGVIQSMQCDLHNCIANMNSHKLA